MYGMNRYAETIDVRELADELDELREQGTCSECEALVYAGETCKCGGDDRPWTVGISWTCHTLFETEDEDEAREFLNNLPDVETGRYYIEQVGAEEGDYAWDREDDEKLADLEQLQSELSGDLRYHGDNLEPTMIREDTFEEYAQELAEDVGAIGADLQWPLMHIDWEAAADALKIDYTSVEYDGHTWLIRSC